MSCRFGVQSAGPSHLGVGRVLVPWDPRESPGSRRGVRSSHNSWDFTSFLRLSLPPLCLFLSPPYPVREVFLGRSPHTTSPPVLGWDSLVVEESDNVGVVPTVRTGVPVPPGYPPVTVLPRGLEPVSQDLVVGGRWRGGPGVSVWCT